ncbi:[protein release factor]-glutamine N5-methyltransferase [Mariprofundus ferrinatatus]|uniref:Release factor glutamine methyltransferase n=1 Tax=Mariprofundus ferrinatatus TaxID=1921087 RepID=A0A2K8L1R1_9PROT|nr:peptide chain release factor N(5)-glutamine methyltransferase [Mariprofundus ferrinatatus]ATX81183.1 [protein release factor]-glutamine N5-methyltransferase [Mariprofundus ferrinatatus]
MIIRDLLREAFNDLQQAGCDSARLDAELLLMHISGLSRTDLIIRALDEAPKEIEQPFRALVARRASREPLAYITGEKEFWSRLFRVTPDVLIPRPETEHLIEAVLERFPDQHDSYTFCDIGTGSGCIAVTLACEYPASQIVATDISIAALEVAKSNAERLDVADRITFRHGDMLQALDNHDGPFDAIISNPPYVAYHEMDGLEAELSHEPRGALTDERDGLKFLATILAGGSTRLKPDGHIIVETGSCGLPETPSPLLLKKEIFDLAGHLRGGIFQTK